MGVSRMYDPEKADKLKGIALPDKIKCGRCSKVYNQAKFSIVCLTNAREQIKNSGRIVKAINCRICNGERPVELECTMCYKTKGIIVGFSKAQRNKPDTAKCYKCMDEQVTEQPINDAKYLQSGGAFVTPDNSRGHYPEYFSSAASTTDSSSTWNSLGNNPNDQQNDSQDGGIALTRQMGAMYVSSSANETLGESENAYPSARDFKNRDSDGYTEARTKSWHTKSAGPVSASSGFESSKYGKLPAMSATESGRSYASTAAERSETYGPRANGWVKKSEIPLGTTTGLMRPIGDDEREREPVVDAWDSDEDDEAENDDDDDDSDDDTQI